MSTVTGSISLFKDLPTHVDERDNVVHLNTMQLPDPLPLVGEERPQDGQEIMYLGFHNQQYLLHRVIHMTDYVFLQLLPEEHTEKDVENQKSHVGQDTHASVVFSCLVFEPLNETVDGPFTDPTEVLDA
jgi:hypothetical protein